MTRLALAAAVALAFTCSAPEARATPPRPADLEVAGGSDSWHPDNYFSLTWTSPAPADPALVATHYRIRDPHGNPLAEGAVHRTSDGLAALAVPRIPAVYSIEVWFEDATGARGPAATAPLRFDDTRPAAAGVEAVPDWIGRTAFPLRVRLVHPLGAPPPAGIRGYAVSIDAAPDRDPCRAADRCSDAETTLRGGIGDDTVEVPALPEGTSYLHAVAVSGSGMKSRASARARLRVDLTDPFTDLAGVPRGWTNRSVWLVAHATDADSGMEPDGDGPPPFTAIRVDDGAPSIGLGASAETSVIEEGAHRVAYFARDAAGNVADGGQSNGIGHRPPRVAEVRIDRTAPDVAFTNSQDPHDPDLLRVRIGDALSGPDLSRGRIGVRPTGSGDSFETLPTVPAAEGKLRARWDSDAYPAGEYEFRATGFDAAGNVAVTTRRGDGARMVLSNPLKASTGLDARFGGGPPVRTVPYGHGVRLVGRLTTGRSSPLAGMPVRIVERFGAGTEPGVRVSTVGTGPAGRYSIRLAPGPSREVIATFDGTATLRRSHSRALRLAVRSAVRLHASSEVARVGGAPLVFRGKVLPPAALPPGGKSVQLQFRLPGLPWSEFRTIQCDRSGRFRYAYRFSDDDSRGVRFQFRAYAPAQEDWPYEPAGSRPVLVLGR